MTKEQAYHICRAAAAVAGVEYVHVFGSNAIVFWLEDSEDTDAILKPFFSKEMDLSVGDGTVESEDLNLVVDAAIGEGSYFHRTFGVYAHANPSQGLFKAPDTWVGRAKIERVPGTSVKVVVPHPLDLIFSKILGFRDKDWHFAVKVAERFGITVQQVKEVAEEYLREHPEEEEIVRNAVAIFSHKFQNYLKGKRARKPGK